MIKKIINVVWESWVNYLYNTKLRKIANNLDCSSTNKHLETEYKRKWKKISRNCHLLYPRCFSSINNIYSADYVPENIYYNKIEPVLNNKAYALAYSDKNFYERYLNNYKHIFPKAFLRGINGVLFDHEFNKIISKEEAFHFLDSRDDFILKPATETSGGANVVLIGEKNNAICINNKPLTKSELFSQLMNRYNGSFVIQERVSQHEWFKDFNHTSLNTVRIFTYRSVSDEKVHALHAVVRFGKEGSLVDNQASGGLSCGVNSIGLLNSFAVDKYGKKYDNLPCILSKANNGVVEISKMKRFACEIASYYHYQRLLGFDFCCDKTGEIYLLEINCKNLETNFLQMNNGPLFGVFTEEIIDFCRKNRKSLVFDFYI